MVLTLKWSYLLDYCLPVNILLCINNGHAICGLNVIFFKLQEKIKMFNYLQEKKRLCFVGQNSKIWIVVAFCTIPVTYRSSLLSIKSIHTISASQTFLSWWTSHTWVSPGSLQSHGSFRSYCSSISLWKKNLQNFQKIYTQQMQNHKICQKMNGQILPNLAIFK